MDLLGISVLNAVLKLTNVEAFRELVIPILPARPERMRGARQEMLSRTDILNAANVTSNIELLLEDIMNIALLTANPGNSYGQLLGQIGSGVMKDVLGLDPPVVTEHMSMEEWFENVSAPLEAFAVYVMIMTLGSEMRLNVSAEEHRRSLYDPLLRAMETKRTAHVVDGKSMTAVAYNS